MPDFSKCCFGWRIFGGKENSSFFDEEALIVVEVEKPKQDSYIGLSLRKYKVLNCIMIHAVADDGLLVGTKLRPGQRLVSINHIPCPEDDLKSTIRLLKGAPAGTLRLEATEV
jgi:hypothetical protein